MFLKYRSVAFNFQSLNKINKSYFSISISSKNDSNGYIEIRDTDKNGLIRRIVMVNDKQRNCLSLNAIKHLQNAIKNTDVNKYRIIILSAGKRNVFSSGHNLKELSSENMAEQVFKEMSNLCEMLRKSPLPTIAEVYGLAAAGGCQLAASCDILVASDKATFSTPGVKFGIFCSTPGMTD
jgi:enoyl-CoA hydratase/carnithine racemase